MLRRDYEEASRRYWDRYYAGNIRYDANNIRASSGRLLEVSPVFVFRSGSSEYFTLMHGCYVERATFHVPSVLKGEINPIDSAYLYLHGKPRRTKALMPAS